MAHRGWLKALIDREGAEEPKPAGSSFVGTITQDPLNELRLRESKFIKASMGLLVANVLALGLWGACSVMSRHSTLDATIGQLEIPAHVYKVVEAATSQERRVRDRFPLHFAVMDEQYETVTSLIKAAELPANERQYVVAQLDLIAGSTGTQGQRAVVGELRRGVSYTAADGQWVYAMEMAADGHVETQAAVNYRWDTLQSGQSWVKAAAIAADAAIFIALATSVCSTLGFILRRRIGRIDAMLKQLA